MFLSMRKFFFRNWYKFYMDKSWPLVSYNRNGISLLNIAYPDSTSFYHCMTVKKTDTVQVIGKYPKDSLFWNLVFYDEKGEIFFSIEECDFPNYRYNFFIQNGEIYIGDITVPIPCDYFCMIQRLYTIDTHQLFPKYLPRIKNQSRMVRDITPCERTEFSLSLSRWIRCLNYFYFFKYDRNIDFKYPSHKIVKTLFPNPQATYLVSSPLKHGDILHISGTLPDVIHRDSVFQYMGFMTCNFSSISTDDSISHLDLSKNYEIFVGYENTDWETTKFNSKIHHRLLWRNQNNYPIVVFRILFSSFETIHMGCSDKSISSTLGPFLPKVATLTT